MPESVVLDQASLLITTRPFKEQVITQIKSGGGNIFTPEVRFFDNA
jgi:hypothetical protein